VNYLNYLGIQLDGNVAIEVAVDVSIQKWCDMGINDLSSPPSKSSVYIIRETIKEERSQHTVRIWWFTLPIYCWRSSKKALTDAIRNSRSIALCHDCGSP
jgi:hypothetical protein